MRKTYCVTTLKVLPVYLAEQHLPTAGYFDKIAVTKNLRSQVVLRVYILSVGAYRALSDNGKKEIPDEDVKKILEPYKDLVIHGVDDEAHKEATFDELC